MWQIALSMQRVFASTHAVLVLRMLAPARVTVHNVLVTSVHAMLVPHDNPSNMHAVHGWHGERPASCVIAALRVHIIALLAVLLALGLSFVLAALLAKPRPEETSTRDVSSSWRHSLFLQLGNADVKLSPLRPQLSQLNLHRNTEAPRVFVLGQADGLCVPVKPETPMEHPALATGNRFFGRCADSSDSRFSDWYRTLCVVPIKNCLSRGLMLKLRA